MYQNTVEIHTPYPQPSRCYRNTTTIENMNTLQNITTILQGYIEFTPIKRPFIMSKNLYVPQKKSDAQFKIVCVPFGGPIILFAS